LQADQQPPIQVNIVLLSPIPANATDLARALISHGCEHQLDQLIMAGQ